MVQSRQKLTKETVDKEEFLRLQNELNTLKKLISTNVEISNKIENNKHNEEEDDGGVPINSDKYIKVMSLTPYLLTLTTQEYGRGKKFDFHKFGEVKRILYHDLCDIMEQHQNFLNEGYFVILDKDVVRKHGLNEVYAKILTKDKIDLIIAGNDSDAVNLFKACTFAQQESIATILIDKMLSGIAVDLNLIDRLSRVIGYNIANRAEEIRQIQNIGKKEEEKK